MREQPATRAELQTEINSHVALAGQYVKLMDDELTKLAVETNPDVRAECWIQFYKCKHMLDEINIRIEAIRPELDHLERVIIDKFKGNCVVCHQPGHVSGQCLTL